MSSPSVAEPLASWVDPEAVFAAWEREHEHVFWLDAGPRAEAGWSWVGAGTPEAEPARVRARQAAQVPAGEGSPFRGGWVGWIGYEQGAAAAGAPVRAGTDPVPDEAWLRVDELVAFDHAALRVWAIGAPGRIPDLTRRIRDVPAAPPVPPAPDRRTATARHTPSQYADLIERCRDRIRDGHAYQLCLTTRFTVAGPVDAVAAWRRLRAASP